MLEKELSFADLPISLSEIYETMGYADAVPDEAVEKEVRGVLGRVEAVTSPRFCFFISGGDLDETKDLLTVGKTSFSIGKIITRQLRGSESFAFFAATAGTGFGYHSPGWSNNSKALTRQKEEFPFSPSMTG